MCRACPSPAAPGRRYCSDGCLPDATHRSSRRQFGPAEIACRHCTEPLVATRVGQHYCSATCNNRARKRRAYAAGSRRRFPKFTPAQRRTILERDDWRCGLCGGAIDPALRWPHPGSASIDHVDPDGAHEPANWQASHLVCNVQAGAKRAAA